MYFLKIFIFLIFFLCYSYYSYNYDINYFNQNDINKNRIIVQEDYKIILTTSTNEVFIRVFK